MSANGSDVDDEIQPEGMTAVFKNSTDPYYKEHGIQKFRDLLKCVDDCTHVQPPAILPPVSTSNKEADKKTVRRRLNGLNASLDSRIMFIVRCMKRGLRWAGSSGITFLSTGVEGLLPFLSETNEDGSLQHDVDLYRVLAKSGSFGTHLIKSWEIVGKPARKGCVTRYSLQSSAAGLHRLAIDHVCLIKGSMRPSTDVWPNLCVYYDTDSDELKVGKLFSNEGPPLALTLHNALKLGQPDATCYVLRRQVMPVYDNGVFVPNDLT